MRTPLRITAAETAGRSPSIARPCGPPPSRPPTLEPRGRCCGVIPGEREAMTRGPHPGRRDRAGRRQTQPAATRRVACPFMRGSGTSIWTPPHASLVSPPARSHRATRWAAGDDRHRGEEEASSRKRVVPALEVVGGLLEGLLPGVAVADGQVDVIEDVPTVVAVVDSATTADLPWPRSFRPTVMSSCASKPRTGSSQEWMSCSLEQLAPVVVPRRTRRRPRPMQIRGCRRRMHLDLETGREGQLEVKAAAFQVTVLPRAVRSSPGPPIQPNPWTAQRRSSATGWSAGPRGVVASSAVPRRSPGRRTVLRACPAGSGRVSGVAFATFRLLNQVLPLVASVQGEQEELRRAAHTLAARTAPAGCETDPRSRAGKTMRTVRLYLVGAVILVLLGGLAGAVGGAGR